MSAKLGMTQHDVLEALVANIADAVYLVDVDGRVEFANPAAFELLGWDEDLLGRISHATIHHHHWDGSAFPQDECPMLRPRLTGKTVRVYGDTFWRRDGSKFRVAYSSAPLATERGNGAVVVFRDVTAHMEAEEAARRRAVDHVRAQEIHASRARIIEAADAERRRLARNLHDGAQQRLVRILLALRLAGKDTAVDDPGLAGLLARIADDTEAAIAELRDLGSGIRPSILTTRGVRAAIESLTGPFPIPVTIDVTEQRFPDTVEAGAYFFIAEALTNVIKHAEATMACVRLRITGPGTIAIEVADDGRGGAVAVPGRGLAGMQDRLAALEGSLAIDSPAGGGTRLTATLPVALTTPAAV
ncbi:MAG TPA: PAS domain S-box protein [Solirubrobacteraceae bacterium]|nr:PAS domain S-box protein [Solirubrobacteraceae bacterium]